MLHLNIKKIREVRKALGGINSRDFSTDTADVLYLSQFAEVSAAGPVGIGTEAYLLVFNVREFSFFKAKMLIYV